MFAFDIANFHEVLVDPHYFQEVGSETLEIRTNWVVFFLSKKENVLLNHFIDAFRYILILWTDLVEF